PPTSIFILHIFKCTIDTEENLLYDSLCKEQRRFGHLTGALFLFPFYLVLSLLLVLTRLKEAVSKESKGALVIRSEHLFLI
ncbi:MAG: hypothetical protein MJ116_11350, partial [Lachnospiraceae bacterium]|nr:hypothetical protein [Lachnospiraceae bacterium]